MFYKLKLWLKVCKKVVKVLIAEVLVFWIVVKRERVLCVHCMQSGVYYHRAVECPMMACLVTYSISSRFTTIQNTSTSAIKTFTTFLQTFNHNFNI
jgi:hypothetical protein